MSATIREHGSRFHAVDASRLILKLALRSAESRIQICASQASLQEKVGRLQSGKTHLEEQYEPEARCAVCTRYVLDIESETNRSLCENNGELKAQQD